MIRLVFLAAAAVALGAEPTCAKKPEPRSDGPTAPLPAVTTPPIYQPAEPTPVPPTAIASASSRPADPKKVRALLDRKVRAGNATADETQSLFDVCTVLKDKACLAALHAAHPETTAK